MNEPAAANESIPRGTERAVGLFVLLALVLLLAGFAYYLYHTAERKGWRVPRCPYYTLVMSGEGLNLGDPVMLMGFEVGEITTITAQPPGSFYRVYVGFEVKRPYYGYIWSDSKVKIAPAGFLGSRRLEVTTGIAGAPTVYEKNDRIGELLVDGKRLPFSPALAGVFIVPEEDPALTERAEKLLRQVEGALPSILAITNRVNLALDHASLLLTNSVALVTNLNATVAQTQPILSNATVITANLRDPHGALGDWLVPGDLHTSLNTNLAALAGNLNNTILNLAAITSNLNTQVQANDQILGSISKLVVDTDNLVQGLKKHWLLRGAFRATNAPPAKPASFTGKSTAK